jgi:uncharacterized lipoprotein YbaY
MKKILFLTSIISVLIFQACKKDSSNVDAPKITIESPIDESAYKLTDTVFIKATITHTEELHSYKVSARQSEDGSVTFIKDEHEHAKNVTIDTWFFPNVTSHKHYYIIVDVEDHDGLTSRDSVLVHIDN